jgi:ubiquitin-conjugating enzyme E2 D/E
MNFIRRLTINYNDLLKNPPNFCYAEPKDPSQNMTNWTGYIDGPEDTPYAGGRFYLTIDFPSDYPFKPPTIYFTTPIYHPNISAKGEICLDILHSQWSPALGIRDLLLSLCSLLTDPNSEHGLNKEALRLYRADVEKYHKVVREWTEKYAMKKNN